MPYIDQDSRERLLFNVAETPGELNYIFTQLITNYMYINGESYQTYNDIIGALEGAKLELYRRKIAPYEDKKCELNGDVY